MEDSRYDIKIHQDRTGIQDRSDQRRRHDRRIQAELLRSQRKDTSDALCHRYHRDHRDSESQGEHQVLVVHDIDPDPVHHGEEQPHDQRDPDLLKYHPENIFEFDLTDRQLDFSSFSFDRDALAVLAVPSYGGRVPALAAARIAALRADGTPAVMLCVYGNRAFEDTLVELEDLADAAGFCPVAGVAAIA